MPAAARTALRLAAFGALTAGACVAGGAFGAHALKSMVTPERLATFETAIRYGLAHGLAFLALGALVGAVPSVAPLARRVGWLWGIGVVVFAKSLVLLVLLDVPALGAITPIGGVLMIAGWAWLAWGLWAHSRAPGRADGTV